MEPLVHFVAPLIALIVVGLRLREALLISVVAVLPDLDVLFLVHRSLSHSIIVVLMAAAPFLLLTYKFKPELRGYVFLALASTISHLALDVFAGYTPFLWPFTGYSVWIKTSLVAHVGSSPSFMPSAELLTKPTTFQPFPSFDAPLFTGEGLILSAVLLLPVLLKLLKTGWHQLKELTTR